jgi:hypothetical protein
MGEKRWGRQYHERMIAEELNYVRLQQPYMFSCSPEAFYASVRVNRAIAHARTHLVSIGPQEGKRTRKMWGAVGRAEKVVNEANNRIARCLLKPGDE